MSEEEGFVLPEIKPGGELPGRIIAPIATTVGNTDCNDGTSGIFQSFALGNGEVFTFVSADLEVAEQQARKIIAIIEKIRGMEAVAKAILDSKGKLN